MTSQNAHQVSDKSIACIYNLYWSYCSKICTH